MEGELLEDRRKLEEELLGDERKIGRGAAR